jgi:hypothetical protein
LIRRNLVLLAAVALAISACTGDRIINNSDPRPETPTAVTTAPATTPISNVHLVNAFHYVAHVGEMTGYYFTTPSGKWRCAILSHTKAGCQASSSWRSGLGIQGAPESVPDAAGQDTAPNAIVVDREGDPQFIALAQPEFWLDPGPAKALQFNRILAAAGFRCNVQEESGVSCLSETSGKGFTFSQEGYTPQYTDVPAGAP